MLRFLAIAGFVLVLLSQLAPAEAACVSNNAFAIGAEQHTSITVQQLRSISGDHAARVGNLDLHQESVRELDDHDHLDHDASGHTHPVGEDPLHQLMFHCSLDFAAHAELQTACAFQCTEWGTLYTVQIPSGIGLIPPVPPPLA